MFAMAASAAAPLQYFYENDTVTSGPHVDEAGCVRREWVPVGGDPNGVAAPPPASSIDCTGSGGDTTLAGVLRAGGGALAVYVSSPREGDEPSLIVNGHALRTLGSMAWVQDGAALELRLARGAALFALGADLSAMVEGAGAQVAPSSYLAPVSRAYLVEDALANATAQAAALSHDEHISSATGRRAARAKDLTWGSLSGGVDPAHLVVINCESTGSSVDDHLHPSGATYVPFAGSICFERAREGGARIRRACVGAGAARWVSPLLRYRETFSSSGGGALAAARELAARAGMDDVGACSARGPVVFAVTNFDAASNASVPNFVDVPDPSRPMTVRSTYVRAVTLEWPDEAADDAFA